MNDLPSADPWALPNSDEPSWLVHQWIVAGIVSASSRFIPIPFVDDIVRSQCRRFVIARTLAVHDRSNLMEEIEPYFVSPVGCLGGCLGTVAKAPLKLLLFPVRKIVAIVTSIRGVPLEVTRMVLLGRTLDRQLRLESIDKGSAAKMKLAFEESFSRMDFHIVRAAISDALKSVSGWKSSATDTARTVAQEPSADETVLTSSPTVDASATKVQEALDRTDMLELFAQFDKRFDEAMERMG